MSLINKFDKNSLEATISNNIYYLGKLRRTREFIRSINLTINERLYWDNWFNRCLGTYQLMPFLKKSTNYSKIWIFVIRDDLVFRFGIISLSADLTGREYPFLIYKKSTLDDLKLIEISTILYFFLQRSLFFSNILIQGTFNNFDYEQFLLESQNIILENKTNVIDMLVYNIENEIFISNWFELNNNRYITHTNMLTCSLYNKIFG